MIDETDWSKIEEIIIQEAEKAIKTTKIRISELKNS